MFFTVSLNEKRRQSFILFLHNDGLFVFFFFDLAWLETADLLSYLTEKDCRQRVQFAVKSSTLDSHDMPSFNYSERKTQYRSAALTWLSWAAKLVRLTGLVHYTPW